MRSMSRLGGLLALLSATALLTTLPAGPAQARGGTSGSSGQGKIGAGVNTPKASGIVIRGRGNRPSLITPVGNWKPPACWYEPRWTAAELKSLGDGFDKLLGTFFGLDKVFENAYGNYHTDEAGSGMWWGPVQNPDRKGDPESAACDKPPFWADTDDPPKVSMAVTPEIMAQYAYKALPLPGLDVSMSPRGLQTVNMPTWLWTKSTGFRPVAVTATLPHTGLSATTTAKPSSLHVDPGTVDARAFPASGECPIGSDGRIGTPYTPGAQGDPACGVLYERITSGEPFALRATVTWTVTWRGSDGSQGTLTPGASEETNPVSVRELQSVVRPTS